MNGYLKAEMNGYHCLSLLERHTLVVAVARCWESGFVLLKAVGCWARDRAVVQHLMAWTILECEQVWDPETALSAACVYGGTRTGKFLLGTIDLNSH